VSAGVGDKMDNVQETPIVSDSGVCAGEGKEVKGGGRVKPSAKVSAICTIVIKLCHGQRMQCCILRHVIYDCVISKISR
jgi:hypothetical protein